MYCLKVAVNITAFAIARRTAILKVTRSSCDAVLQAHPGTNGPASAEPPARTHRAGGTALANVEPEELSYLLASPSPQDSSLQVLLCRRHAQPDTNVTVCSPPIGQATWAKPLQMRSNERRGPHERARARGRSACTFCFCAPKPQRASMHYGTRHEDQRPRPARLVKSYPAQACEQSQWRADFWRF